MLTDDDLKILTVDQRLVFKTKCAEGVSEGEALMHAFEQSARHAPHARANRGKLFLLAQRTLEREADSFEASVADLQAERGISRKDALAHLRARFPSLVAGYLSALEASERGRILKAADGAEEGSEAAAKAGDMEAEWRAEFAASKALQREFLSVEPFLAYQRAQVRSGKPPICAPAGEQVSQKSASPPPTAQRAPGHVEHPGDREIRAFKELTSHAPGAEGS